MLQPLFVAIALIGAEPITSVDFYTEILPVLTRAGCNTGACHGAAIGRGGFRLSLYGGDPEADYLSIVRESEGRRLHWTAPADSLLLRKTTGQIEHGGGYLFDAESESAELLTRWIEGGASGLHRRRLVAWTVSPREEVVGELGGKIQLHASASFSDGSQEDVTRWTVFTATDSEAVEIDSESAAATVKRRGVHIVIARYLDRVAPLRLVMPLAETPVDLSGEPRHNFIDEHVLDTLATLRVPVSPTSEDAEFLRRITLDLTGRLPTLSQIETFNADTSPEKRDGLIDTLLGSPAFVDYWSLQFSNWLRVRSEPNTKASGWAYYNWIHDQLEHNTPYDRWARELLIATGDTHEFGPANFYRVVGGARAQAEFVSELFLGARLRCANCHNHPLDRWTQDDYHGLAAIFARLERGRIIKTLDRGEVTHPKTGQPARPRIPGQRFLTSKGDPRQAFAEWLTAPDNRQFAAALVNRLWKATMGRGLVEPIDDHRDTNPATHPELLDALSDDFVRHGYDIRHTLRQIAQSAAYQRASQSRPGNASDDRFYSHALRRSLRAEVYTDAVADVTGVPVKYEGFPEGIRSVGLPFPEVDATTLDVLGRCGRDEACVDNTSPLTKKLHLLNGPFVNERVVSRQGRLHRMLADGKSHREIIEAFYRRALSRSARSDEHAFWEKELSSNPDRDLVLEDFLWSLLNSREFATNH